MSFHDILLEKMQSSQAASSSVHASVDYDKAQAHVDFTIFDLSPRYFQAPPKKKPQPSVQATPAPVAAPPAPRPIERTIEKMTLSEDAQTKWNLFEKTFSVDLGNVTTQSKAMTAFRQFLKKHHPDITGQSARYNFSTLVKIKDEFMLAIKKS